MSLRKLSSLMMLAAFVFVAAACSKDDETETKPSLSGLYFNCPSFVSPGEAVRFVPKGLKHPEGGVIGYAWKVTPTMSVSDTMDVDEVYVHWFSDTLQTYTVNCSAFAEGYYGDTYSKDVTVVQGGLNKSITGTDIWANDPKVVVDGVSYYYQRIGNLDWFRNNLAVTTCGTAYANTEIMSDVFGRYYNYNEAMTACPEGWRLPTEEDWMSLAEEVGSPVSQKYVTFEDVASKLLANASFNGKPMQEYWPAVGDITNSSKIAMLPVGYANLGNVDNDGNYPGASFDGVLEYSVFWTADKENDEMAYYRYIISGLPDMLVGHGDINTFAASVRCVRDAE